MDRRLARGVSYEPSSWDTIHPLEPPMEHSTHPTPKDQSTTARLTEVRNSLAGTLARAAMLAEEVQRLERHFLEMTDPDPFDFYVPTDSPMGLKVWTFDASGEPVATDQVGPGMKDDFLLRNPRMSGGKANSRREAVKAALALRASIDESIRLVGTVADIMDDTSKGASDRWTAQTVGDLRKLRGAITWGHPLDPFPSALPMIKRGVVERLYECSQMVRGRMEAIKSAMAAGAMPVDQKMAALIASIGRLEAMENRLAKTKLTSDDEVISNEFMPASWFPATCRDRLRQAATAKNRKSMRVDTKVVQGQKRYSVRDFAANWPEDYQRHMRQIASTPSAPTASTRPRPRQT